MVPVKERLGSVLPEARGRSVLQARNRERGHKDMLQGESIPDFSSSG